MVNPLVSIPQLVEDGCEVTLTDKAIKVSKNNKPIIRGPRDPLTRMWTIPFTVNKSQPEQALHTIEIWHATHIPKNLRRILSHITTLHWDPSHHQH